MEILTLNSGQGLPYYLAIIVMFAVSMVRLVLYKSKKPWTNKIGGAKVWIGLAGVVSVVMCIVLKINVISDLTNLQGIGSLKFTGLTGYIASGILISLSSNIGAWAAGLPGKLATKDLKEGNSVPGTVEPVLELTPILEPILESTPIDISPKPVYYRTILLNPWTSKDSPGYLMIERDDGVKRVLTLSKDEKKSVEEVWSKISNLEV